MEAQVQELENHFSNLFRQYPCVVEKIVKYIPLDQRWKIAAVSKDFYGLICSIDKFKYKMVIYGTLDNTFESILNSNRKFNELNIKKMELREDHLKKLKKIAAKHGTSITKLYLEDLAIDFQKDHELLSKFLKNLPNLEEWEVENFTNRSKKVTVKVQPVLTNLKSLSIKGSKLSTFVKYSHFIAHNSLESFKFDGYNVQNVATIFNRHSTLTSIKIVTKCKNTIEDNPEILSTMNLEEVYWHRKSLPPWINDFFVQRVLRDHPNLKKIDLGKLRINGTIAEMICSQALQLQTLHIILVLYNIKSFMEIERLTNLQEVDLEIVDHIHMPQLDAFSKLNLPSVKKLKINFKVSGLNVDVLLSNFGNNWSNVEDLSVNEVNSVNVILISFLNLKALELGRYKDFHESFRKFPMIETFKVHNENSGIELQNLSKLIESMPYLRNLQVSKSFELKLIHSLTSLRKLIDLQALFKIDSFTVKFQKTYAEVIKKLCQRVPKFSIEIEIIQNYAHIKSPKFVDELAEFLDSNDRCCIIGVDKYYRNELYEAIRLKNLKY